MTILSTSRRIKFSLPDIFYGEGLSKLSNVLRQNKPEVITQGQRFANFVKSLRDLNEQFYNRIARIDSTYPDLEKYAFLLFMRDHIDSLDRSSQIIFYHVMKNIDIKATTIITSLSEEKINQVLIFMEKSAYVRLESFDYEAPVKDYWELKAFIDDLVYSYDKSDADIVKIYGESTAVIKILRHLSKKVFNK